MSGLGAVPTCRIRLVPFHCCLLRGIDDCRARHVSPHFRHCDIGSKGCEFEFASSGIYVEVSLRGGLFTWSCSPIADYLLSVFHAL